MSTNKRKEAEVAFEYQKAIAIITSKFMDDNPHIAPQVIAVALLQVNIGFYRELHGATKERFINGAEVLWDTMAELEPLPVYGGLQ